ncbi:protein Wiz-like [Corythoichthys intestinalis]|uniref:protein Wiz-like n=1 Tax=Corythoichthys intestinalis TaxID=161448 RepID=UPI0025A59B28|nr:protein Wiz-like [Corythoichthys intestinalis]XP_057698555.1 protein Wiz-like [Corythoichthys intestinalis]XP_057698556.1 protein Wiz-like [Corythoichthys intestinalis]XP_057698557.1 protein Wiz-like [Corythoichthys intestinalis]
MATTKEMDLQRSPARISGGSPPNTSRSACSRQEGSALSSKEYRMTTKPLWAPLETDAPVTLASNINDEEIHACQLCSRWYETRQGLSSHARFHLQEMGIPDTDIKGSPIEFLYQLMQEEDLKSASKKHREPNSPNSLIGASAKRPSELSSPPKSLPCKRPKPLEEFTCILCGEICKNRRGLASHSRSHLRQIGVLDLLGKHESAIDTVQDLVSSGVLESAPNPKKNSTTNSLSTPSPAPTSPLASPPVSPVKGQSGPSFPSTFPSLEKSPQNPVNRAPKAKKGFRLAVDPLLRKPKPETLEVDMSLGNGGGSSSSTPPQNLSPPVTPSKDVAADEVSPPTVLCDYCGQLFETRKALSCHARAHLRQLGLSWSIRTSPIDILKEVMIHGEDKFLSGEVPSTVKTPWSPQGSKRTSESQQTISNHCSSPVDYSMKDKSPSSKSGAVTWGISCELCGFNFENRKALASHARAHLRQLGVLEWKAEGANSPIELLKELIQKDPVKVAAVTRRYREGDLYIKKKNVSQSNLSEPESSPGGNPKFSGHKLGKHEQNEAAVIFKKPQSFTDSVADNGSADVRSPKALVLPKQLPLAGEENQDTNSQQLSRSGSIPALLPKPPLTPLVKLVGKVYSLKCRFCEKVFHGPLSVQEQWITHLQKHILSLGYKGQASPPAAPASPPSLIQPVAV